MLLLCIIIDHLILQAQKSQLFFAFWAQNRKPKILKSIFEAKASPKRNHCNMCFFEILQAALYLNEYCNTVLIVIFQSIHWEVGEQGCHFQWQLFSFSVINSISDNDSFSVNDSFCVSDRIFVNTRISVNKRISVNSRISFNNNISAKRPFTYYVH